jgi:hypothetical protein
VAAGWSYDVAAVAPDVDARPKASPGVVAYDTTRMSNVDVKPARSRPNDPGVGQRTVPFEERGEAFVASVWRVDVDDDEAARSAGADGDVGVRPAGPPLAYSVLVGGGGLESSGHPGMFCRR